MSASNPSNHRDDDALLNLRVELRRQLALQQKSSLYTVLGLAADCTDAAIGEAVARITAGGVAADAEMRYALEILGRPESREAFDRQLMDQLRKPKPVPIVIQPAMAQDGRSPWLVPVTLGIFGVLLLGMGWLGLNYMKENADREMKLLEAQARAEESRRRAEAIPKTSELMRQAVEASAATQQRELDAQDKAGEEARLREERFRDEREKVYQQQLAREEKLRQEAEKSATNQATRDVLNSMSNQAARSARER
ncbi:MAG: hypothetical protein HZA62_14300 [Rhodocyclales bacterium]|nr:hypothetical protein [Rhodocyclales bacterium]